MTDRITELRARDLATDVKPVSDPAELNLLSIESHVRSIAGNSPPACREHIDVCLVSVARDALADAVDLTGYSRTDTVNRALQFYAFAMRLRESGRVIFTGNPDGTEMERITLS